MSDEELIARLRALDTWVATADVPDLAADRIEELIRKNDDLFEFAQQEHSRAERLEAALREIAAEASVPVRTKKKGGIKHKWMYRGWRKIAVERIDIARAALKGDDYE